METINNPFETKAKIRKSIPTGSYEMKVLSFTLNQNDKGGNIQVTLANKDYELVHTIFPKNVEYNRDTIGQQLELKSDVEYSLVDVLNAAIDKTLKVYISHPEINGRVFRNVSFGTQVADEVNVEDAL